MTKGNFSFLVTFTIIMILVITLIFLFVIYKEKVATRDKRITALENKISEIITISNVMFENQIFESNYHFNGYKVKKHDKVIYILPNNKLIDDFYGFFFRVNNTKEMKILEFDLYKP